MRIALNARELTVVLEPVWEGTADTSMCWEIHREHRDDDQHEDDHDDDRPDRPTELSLWRGGRRKRKCCHRFISRAHQVAKSVPWYES
jgi:hypothetical protein